MTIRFRVRKRNADGTFVNIDDGENIAPYNAFLYTLFSELEIEMNNELVRNHTACTGERHHNIVHLGGQHQVQLSTSNVSKGPP